MSRENVELVAANFREFKITQRPGGYLAPDFVWDIRTFRGGHEEYRAPMHGWSPLPSTICPMARSNSNR
jgi:hypothetical protein